MSPMPNQNSSPKSAALGMTALGAALRLDRSRPTDRM